MDVTTDLEAVGQLPLPDPMMDLASLQQLSGLRLPGMSEQEWDAFSSNSLAASLQYLMWPQTNSHEVGLQSGHTCVMQLTCPHHEAPAYQPLMTTK